MQSSPEVFAVFERKSSWELSHAALANRCDYSRFLEDERSISIVIAEIRKAGVKVHPIDLAETTLPELLARIRASDRAILWNLTDGYDHYAGANIPAFARLAGIRHVGSGSYAQMLCQNKPHLKAVAASLGIPVARGTAFRSASATAGEILSEMVPPFFVKPARLDNSIGDRLAPPLCACAEEALGAVGRLMAAGVDEVLVEEFLPGDEYSVIAANTGDWCVECGIIRYAGKFFGSLAKDSEAYSCEFVRGDQCTRMIAHALRLAAGIKLRDYFRADFRCDIQGTPHLLEVNSSPFLVSHAFDRLGTLHFGSRSALFGQMISQSFTRQQEVTGTLAGERSR